MRGRAVSKMAEIHKYIIENGALPLSCSLSQVTAVNRNGDTCTHVSARHGHVGLLRELHTRYGLSIKVTNNEGKTPLHDAAQNGHNDCIGYLISEGNCCVDTLKRGDWTPLMLACSKNHMKSVKLLISFGASLQLCNKDGWTAFHIASREGSSEIVRYLLEINGNCWRTISSNGRTPLHTAALHGHAEIVKILCIECGADVNSKDSCGVTPLMDSVRANHITVTKLLVEELMADLFTEDVLGRSLLHHGAQSGSSDVLSYLVLQRQDENELLQDKYDIKKYINKPNSGSGRMTPLHYAAKEGQAMMIRLLLRFGADISARDSHGRTALDIASNARNGSKAVEILLEHSTPH